MLLLSIVACISHRRRTHLALPAGASDEEADPATRAAREERKREIEAMLAAVYQHGHDELYAPVEQNCVSILAKLRDHSDEDNEATEARAAKRSRPSSARRDTEMLERVRSALYAIAVR